MKTFTDYVIHDLMGLTVLEESAKDKIQRYKVTDPSLIFFIHKYEPHVDWTRISNIEELVEQIGELVQEKVLDKAYSSKKDNYYLKDIDLAQEIQHNMNDPQIQQAWEVYQHNPDEAKQIILKAINDEKKASFDAWIKYFTRDNDVYKKDKAFQYIVMKPVFDESDEKTKASCPELDADAVATIYQRIQDKGGGEQFNVIKTYRAQLTENLKKGKMYQSVGAADGWLRVPGRPCDPENFEQNVRKLKAISTGRGWCTASGMAEPYLRDGDFWFYIKDEIAEAAIRLSGGSPQTPSTAVTEVRGFNNQNQHLYPFAAEIISFVKQKKFTQTDSWVKDLKYAVGVNEAFQTDESLRSKMLAKPFEAHAYELPATVAPPRRPVRRTRRQGYHGHGPTTATITMVSTPVLEKYKSQLKEATLEELKKPARPYNEYEDISAYTHVIGGLFKDDEDILNPWVNRIFDSIDAKFKTKDLYTLRYTPFITTLNRIPGRLHKLPIFVTRARFAYTIYLHSCGSVMTSLGLGGRSGHNLVAVKGSVGEFLGQISPNFLVFVNDEELDELKRKVIQIAVAVAADITVLSYVPTSIQQAINISEETFKDIDFTSTYLNYINYLDTPAKLGGFIEEIFPNLPPFIYQTLIANEEFVQKFKSIILQYLKVTYYVLLATQKYFSAKKESDEEDQKSYQDKPYYDRYLTTQDLGDLRDQGMIETVFGIVSLDTRIASLLELWSISDKAWNSLPKAITKDSLVRRAIQDVYKLLFDTYAKAPSAFFGSNFNMPLCNIPKGLRNPRLNRSVKLSLNNFFKKNAIFTDVSRFTDQMTSLDMPISNDKVFEYVRQSFIHYFEPTTERLSTVNLKTVAAVLDGHTVANYRSKLLDDPGVTAIIKKYAKHVVQTNPGAIRKWSLRKLLGAGKLSKTEYEELLQTGLEAPSYAAAKQEALRILKDKWEHRIWGYGRNSKRARQVRENYRSEDTDSNNRVFQIQRMLTFIGKYSGTSYEVFKRDSDFIAKTGLIFDSHTYGTGQVGIHGETFDEFCNRILTAIQAANPNAIQLKWAEQIKPPETAEQKAEQEQEKEKPAPEPEKRTVERPTLTGYRAAIAAEEPEEAFPEKVIPSCTYENLIKYFLE